MPTLRVSKALPMIVSRVVNGEGSVKPGAHADVQAAVAALNYLPSQAARLLAGSELLRIGMLYNDPSAGYLNQFQIGLRNKASLNHVQLVVHKCESHEHEAQQVAHMVTTRSGEPGSGEHVLTDFELIRRQSDAAQRLRPPVRLGASN